MKILNSKYTIDTTKLIRIVLIPVTLRSIEEDTIISQNNLDKSRSFFEGLRNSDWI